MTQHLTIAACFAILVALCGCGKSEPVEPETAAEPLAQAEATASPAAAKSDAESSIVREDQLEEEAAAEESLAEDYQPPFPDRVHLFLAPKREGKSMASNQEEAVELLGFVNVRDSHKAVLSINGLVYPVAVGDSQFGVEVISIQPPAVVLQRGRQRWQASLAN